MGGLLRCADRRSDIPSALFAYCTYIGYDDGGCGNDTLLIWNRHSCWSGQASIRTPITRWSESQRHQVYLYLWTTNPRVKWGESYDLLVDSNPSSAAQHPRPGRDGVGLRHTKGQADQMNAVVVRLKPNKSLDTCGGTTISSHVPCRWQSGLCSFGFEIVSTHLNVNHKIRWWTRIRSATISSVARSQASTSCTSDSHN